MLATGGGSAIERYEAALIAGAIPAAQGAAGAAKGLAPCVSGVGAAPVLARCRARLSSR